MTQSPIRIGILGAARIAPRAILHPARTNNDINVAAVAARDRPRAIAFADKHDIIRVHDSYDALIADPDIDAIYNPLPNSHHAEWSIKALRAGKHVLCEKPIASNAAEAEWMAQAADETGLVLFEAFHYRYHPLALRVMEIIDSGEIGAIRHIDAQFCIPLIRPRDIRYRYDLAGGALMDLGCYTVNMIRAFSGREPVVTSARAACASPQVDRWIDAEFLLGEEATAHTFCSFFSHVPLRVDIKISGDRGRLRVGNIILPHYYHRLTVETDTGRRTERFSKRSTYAYQLDAFVNAIYGSVYPTDAVDGTRNMRVIDAIYEAAGLSRRGS